MKINFFVKYSLYTYRHAMTRDHYMYKVFVIVKGGNIEWC